MLSTKCDFLVCKHHIRQTQVFISISSKSLLKFQAGFVLNYCLLLKTFILKDKPPMLLLDQLFIIFINFKN